MGPSLLACPLPASPKGERALRQSESERKHVNEKEHGNLRVRKTPLARHWDSQTPPGTLRAKAAPVSITSTGSLVFHPEHPVTMATASHSLCWALVFPPAHWGRGECSDPMVPRLSHGGVGPLSLKGPPKYPAHLGVLCFLQGPPGPQGRPGQPGQQVRQATAASPPPTPCLVTCASNEPKCASRVRLASEGTWAHEAFP